MRYCRIYLLVVTLILLQGTAACIWGQTYHTRSQRALRAYTEAKRAYEFYDYRVAEQRLREAISIDEGFFEAYVLLAEMSFDRRQFDSAVENYRKALEINKDQYKLGYYYLGVSEFNTGQYEAAFESLKRFLSTDEGSEKLRTEAATRIENCLFAFEAIRNPVAFNPVNMGDSINTRFNEYSPAITADGNTLMFTREIETGGNEYFSGMKQEDFYISFRKSDGTWTRAASVGAPLNTRGNEGAQTIGPGGQYMFFTACDRPDGLGRCDIYYSAFNGRSWSAPVNIGGPVNTHYWESQPSVSADGKTLFFVSNRPGGFGGLDIWISKMGSDGNWQEPVNAGDVINTPGDEVTPFIHFDGKTLYFSSNGRPNMGGFDIYVTRLGDDGTWSEPLNIGYPINTHNDEMGLAIESNGYRAYYSSTTTAGRKKDLFYFDLHEEVRPERVSYLRGRVYDYDTRRRLQARYELINHTTGEMSYWAYTTDDGQFLVCLPSGFTYGLNVSADGYLFYSENFPFEDEYTEYKPLVKDIYLKLIRPGEKMVLYNVLFNINSSEILRSSMPELEKLLRIMSENKGLRVEIGGHTDDTGSDELNQRLSEERSLAVVRFLISRGIDPLRLSYKGYGKSLPVEDNTTAEGRRLNRRTEVKIVEIIK
ncbi:MAG: OmpA family protein [Bacteroidales bacterium]